VTLVSNLRLLKRVHDARRRIRDVAAGEAAVADALHAEAIDGRDRAQGALDGAFAAAPERIAAAGRAAELLAMELERTAARQAVVEAEKARAEAERAAEARRQVLAAKEREVRSLEKAIERTRGVLVVGERRAEQGANDDLSGSRRGRGA
jgi:hypothetical protein